MDVKIKILLIATSVVLLYLLVSSIFSVYITDKTNTGFSYLEKGDEVVKYYCNRSVINISIFSSPENTKWWVEELCEDNIIGTWQSSNHVASAYTELFIFRSDYTFTYYKSEYNYTERELNFSGRWGFENNMLIIQKEYRTRIEGGSLREGVLTGTQEYIGGEVVFENIEPAITLNIYLSQFIDQTIDGIVLEEKNITYPSLYMNKVQYWRLAQSDISSELKHSSN